MRTEIRNFLMLTLVKLLSVLFGFIGALSLMRAISHPFHRHIAAVYGGWFNFGLGLSLLWLVASLAIFAYSIWSTEQPYTRHLFNKMDYSLLVLLCSVGIIAGIDAVLAWPVRTNLLVYPITTYILAIILFGELVARLRDKTLLSTIYLLAFFKTYSIWRPIGLFTLLLFVSQLYLLFNYFTTPIRLFSLSAICVLIYFVAFMLNRSLEYDKANIDKLKAERFKSELLTNVSHDIKTPLTSIINYVDLLKNENLQGRAEEYIQILDKKSSRLKILIDDLLEASKAGTGNVKVDIQKINFGEIVGQVAGEFEDSFMDKGLTLVMRHHSESEIALVNADSRHLYRALENLFSNATKYALEGTRVFAEITPMEGKTLFTLQNTAQSPIEMSGDELTEQFIRGDRARQTEGSGLGLYIAKSLVELMGGKFNIKVIGDLFRVEIVL